MRSFYELILLLTTQIGNQIFFRGEKLTTKQQFIFQVCIATPLELG
jgi:hypothetical protein